MPSKRPSPSAPAITKETVLAELPQRMTTGFGFIGIKGLNAEVEAGEAVVVGQPILRLVAVPTTGRHYFAARSTTLHKNQIYRIAAWVRAPPSVKIEIQISDKLLPPGRKATNHGIAAFDPAAHSVFKSSGDLKGRGIEQGPEECQKISVDLATGDGEFVLAFVLISKERDTFKGDGRLGVVFGGLEVAERN